jgi:hypothetical protein
MDKKLLTEGLQRILETFDDEDCPHEQYYRGILNEAIQGLDAGSHSKLNDGFYCEDETAGMVEDMEELGEYLYGWPDATRTEEGKKFYRKYYVDMYVNR